MKQAILLAGLVALSGCTAINQFSKRSELTIVGTVKNAVVYGDERTVESKLQLHGSNRDILGAYKDSMAFILEKISGIK